MTGFNSKRQMSRDKLTDEADTLTIVYQKGYADGKQAAQRPWVGLTDEEFHYCIALKNTTAIAEEVEAKLKERNT